MKTKQAIFKDIVLSKTSCIYLGCSILACFLLNLFFNQPYNGNRYPNKAKFFELLLVIFPILLICIKRKWTNINWLFIWLSVPIFSSTFSNISINLISPEGAGGAYAAALVGVFSWSFMLPFAVFIFGIHLLYRWRHY